MIDIEALRREAKKGVATDKVYVTRRFLKAIIDQLDGPPALDIEFPTAGCDAAR